MWTHCSLDRAELTVLSSWFDTIGKVDVLELVCPKCDRHYLDQRKPTGHVAPGTTNAGGADPQYPPFPSKGRTMRLFDTDRVGCFLDGVGLRLEKTKDNEIKVVDLTLRVQPLTSDLANFLHPDVKALLFTMTDSTPKPLLKAVELKLPIDKQHMDVHLLPSGKPQICLMDAEITNPRVRTEKGVDGYALIFYATIGPVGKDELEYVVNWYTQQRFITFRESQAVMDFANKPPAAAEDKPEKVRHIGRGGKAAGAEAGA